MGLKIKEWENIDTLESNGFNPCPAQMNHNEWPQIEIEKNVFHIHKALQLFT